MKSLEVGDEYLYLKFLGNIDYKNKKDFIDNFKNEIKEIFNDVI